MSAGKPEVQRHETRFAPKANQGTQKNQIACPSAESTGPHAERIKGEILPSGCKQEQKRAEQKRRTDMGYNQVKQARSAYVVSFMLKTDQEIAGQRHAFPGQQEQIGIVCHHHHEHSEKEQMIASREHSDILVTGA